MSKKYVNVKDVEYDDDVLLEFTPDEIAPVYLNGLIPFLQLIAPNKMEFQLKNVPDSIDIFKSLDAVGCRFEKLQFLASENTMFVQHLVQSEQYDTIQTLSLCCTVLGPPDILKTMMSLCSISIMVDQDDPTPFNLTNYLNGFPPTLKKCSIKCERYISRDGDTNKSYIEDLDFTCHSIREDLIYTIAQAFPKLVKLKLSGAIVTRTIFSLNKSLKEFTLLTTRSVTHLIAHKHDGVHDYYRCNIDGSTIPVTVEELCGRDCMLIVTLKRYNVDLSCCIRFYQDECLIKCEQE
jgi:hypothetical protein